MLQDSGVCETRIIRWPIPDRPRVHPLIARTNFRSACFRRNFDPWNIKRFHSRVLPCGSDCKSHTIANHLKIGVRNANSPVLRYCIRNEIRYEEFSTRDSRSKRSGLQRSYLKSVLTDRRVVGIPDTPWVIGPKHGRFPLWRRNDTLGFSEKRDAGRGTQPKETCVQVELFNTQTFLRFISPT